MGKEQRTITFVKPGHLKQAADVFNYLNFRLEGNYRRSLSQQFCPSREQIDEFYSHTRGKSFHAPTINRYVQEGIVLIVYSGKDIIKRVRLWIGDTDPLKAGFWTIRGRFGTDSLARALEEGRFLENVFHCSGSEEEAIREERILLGGVVLRMFEKI